jgi:hypothetical protein
MTLLDEALNEAEARQLDRIEHEFAAHAAKVNAEWAERWPHYCRACSGRGGTGMDNRIRTAPASRSNTSSTYATPCRPRCATAAARLVSTPTIAELGMGNAAFAAGISTMGCW